MTELKNPQPFNLSVNMILRLTDILSRQMREKHHSELKDLFHKEDISEGYNLTSLLHQADLNASLPQMMVHLTEIQHIYDLSRNIWNLLFLNKTDFKATKLWQTMKMITSYKFLYMPETVRRYLTAIQEVPVLVANSLLEPTTMENFPEKILTLQKIFDIVANVRASRNYLLISSVTYLMQQIQNSIHASQWNEFNTYWHIAEKLRSAKWNDTDLIAYGQVLDILHKNLYTHRNESGLLFDKVLEQLTVLVNHLLEDHSGDGPGGVNISVVLDTIVKTLHVLKDLEEKYITAFITTNPLMNADAHNETIHRLFEIFRKGVDIISDPRLLEASNVEKMAHLFGFSRLFMLQDSHRTPGRPEASAEGKVLELWYLTLSPFVKEGSQDDERLLNCTVRDLHRIAVEVLFSNTTLSEALPESHCRFLFASLDTENRTGPHSSQTYTEVLQLLLQNLKALPTFAIPQQSKDLLDEFQCFIRSLELSAGFLSKLDTSISYKNPWIPKMHESLASISGKLPQSHLTCQVPPFGNRAVLNESLPFHLLIPFVMNDTETYSQHLSVNQSTQEQALAPFMSLFSEPDRNASLSEMLENRGEAVNHPQWKNLSAVLSKVANVLNSMQNVTDARLLGIIRKARILVSTALSPNSAKTHPVFEILNRGMNASYFEDVLDSLKLFNVTSETDYRTYLERYFHSWSPKVDALSQSLARLNRHWQDARKVLNFTRVIWNNLFLNEPSLSLAEIWGTIRKVVPVAISLLSGDARQDFRSKWEALLQGANLLRKSFATKNILGQILSIRKVYNIIASISMNKNYPFTVHLSEIMQRIQNATNKPWWNKRSNQEHEELRFMKPNSSDPGANGHFLKILHNHLTTQHNVSSLPFSQDLFAGLLSHGLRRDAEGNLPNDNISEALSPVLNSLLFEENFEHQFDLSQLETLMNESNESLWRISDTLKGGTLILSDSKLEEATDKERIAALYDFSRSLFPREFNQSLWDYFGASSEANIVDILHLSLSPFLDVRNHSAKPQSCSVNDVVRVILQVLLKNATLREALKPSNCEILFTSRDFESRTKPNQTLTALFRSSIRNLNLSPESANLYTDEDISRTLLCIIRSLQFSSGVLSEMDILFNFKNPWIQQTYKSLAAITNALPSNNSICLIPVLDEIDHGENHYPLNIFSSFFTRRTDFHSQNLTNWLVDWNNLSALFNSLEDNVHQYSAMNEALEMPKEAPSPSGVDSFSPIWNLVSQWNLRDVEEAKRGLKRMARALAQNGPTPILEDSAPTQKEAMPKDLLKELKTDQAPNFQANNPNLEYVFERIAYSFVTVTEMLLNENLLKKELGKTASLNNLIAQ